MRTREELIAIRNDVQDELTETHVHAMEALENQDVAELENILNRRYELTGKLELLNWMLK